MGMGVGGAAWRSPERDEAVYVVIIGVWICLSCSLPYPLPSAVPGIEQALIKHLLNKQMIT